jgi:hypothetical protein
VRQRKVQQHEVRQALSSTDTWSLTSIKYEKHYIRSTGIKLDTVHALPLRGQLLISSGTCQTKSPRRTLRTCRSFRCRTLGCRTLCCRTRDVRFLRGFKASAFFAFDLNRFLLHDSLYVCQRFQSNWSLYWIEYLQNFSGFQIEVGDRERLSNTNWSSGLSSVTSNEGQESGVRIPRVISSLICPHPPHLVPTFMHWI